MSKVDAGKWQLKRNQIDVSAFIYPCYRIIAEQAASYHVQVEIDVPEDRVAAYVDERVIRQMLLNLLSNAIKFTPNGGRVDVDISFDGATGSIALFVKDTGIGIAQADIARVIPPFEQVESVQGDLNRGTGLGLPIAKSIVELLGGEFRITSDLDHGTTVECCSPSSTMTTSPPTRLRQFCCDLLRF